MARIQLSVLRNGPIFCARYVKNHGVCQLIRLPHFFYYVTHILQESKESQFTINDRKKIKIPPIWLYFIFLKYSVSKSKYNESDGK